jgi:hypothetical protein
MILAVPVTEASSRMKITTFQAVGSELKRISTQFKNKPCPSYLKTCQMGIKTSAPYFVAPGLGMQAKPNLASRGPTSITEPRSDARKTAKICRPHKIKLYFGTKRVAVGGLFQGRDGELLGWGELLGRSELRGRSKLLGPERPLRQFHFPN